MIVSAAIDAPGAGATIRPDGFVLAGWAASERSLRRVSIRYGGTEVGTTRLLYRRPDVEKQLPWLSVPASGFTAFCVIPGGASGQELVIDVVGVDPEGTEFAIAAVAAQISPVDYRSHDFGCVLDPSFDRVLHREDVYTSGPPSALADPLCLSIVLRYLDAAHRIVDVGCGIGAYGKELVSRGYAWSGCEVVPEFVERARHDGLDARSLYPASGLPFEDGAFDSAIAIEVLEHVSDVNGFLSEIRRVAPSRALFSVPNIATLPITRSLYAVPWHMLEGDHKNFFTTTSLRALLLRFYPNVEVFEYGPVPTLKGPDRSEVYNHIFAVASSGDAG